MLWLIAGYMWLYIHRPFEIWSWLAELRIERVYMLGAMVVFFCSGRFSLPRNRLNAAFLMMLVVLLLSWMTSIYPDRGQKVVEDFVKVGVLYVMIVMTCRSERDLRFLVGAFLFCMALYMGHSFREYLSGRYVWRMGTARMMGIDESFSDPNTFAATIVYSLPMVLPFWRSDPTPRVKKLLIGYLTLAMTCILLTGSRTAFAVIGFVGMMYLLKVSRKRLRTIAIMALLAAVTWSMLPEDRRERYLTLIDPSRGPSNAQASADSRLQLFLDGMRLWGENLPLGVGPGAFGQAAGHGLQAHNVYGQVAGELGTAGVVVFVLMLSAFYVNHRLATKLAMQHECYESHFLLKVCEAVSLTVVLLLIMGWGGHNLYRYTWMWYGAFQVVAIHCLRRMPVEELDFSWEASEPAQAR